MIKKNRKKGFRPTNPTFWVTRNPKQPYFLEGPKAYVTIYVFILKTKLSF